MARFLNIFQEADAALVRAVRVLDQGDFEATPEKLERLWHILSQKRGGVFHAAEEMLVRWLLKNMIGTTTNSERIRRYPLVWDILTMVFSRVPLFSLAKSLADRRFVAVLQHTLKDIAKPEPEHTATESDVDMQDAPAESTANPRKRKRSASRTFGLASQRRVQGCLQSAEAVFEAIRALLSPCEEKSSGEAPTHRMGAEHIKSLFSSSSAEVMETLVPLLTLCNMAVEYPEQGPFNNQSTWMSTLNRLWSLHLQGPGDASDVAIHFSAPALILLGKLKGIPRPTVLDIDAAVQESWSRDLGRFLVRNMILPSRAAFLNRKNEEVMRLAVDISSVSAPAAYPVLFDLVNRSPRVFGGNAAKKDYENWTQTVLDILLQSLKSNRRERSREAVEAILEMAAARNTLSSAPSLRAICLDYALIPNGEEWKLLLSIIKLNPDVFLVSEEGQELLERILQKTLGLESMNNEDQERASQFLMVLANGYAQARDLSTFIKVWLRQLSAATTTNAGDSLWAREELAATVANLLEQSLTTTQLQAILNWLSTQTGPAESIAKMHILGAISDGISHEEYIDAASLKTFDAAFDGKISRKELIEAFAVSRWTVAERSLSRATLEEVGRIWRQIRPDLEHILQRSPIRRLETFAAFKTCVAAWLSSHPHCPLESEPASLTCSFVRRLDGDTKSAAVTKKPVTRSTYISWILSSSPRIVRYETDRSWSIL